MKTARRKKNDADSFAAEPVHLTEEGFLKLKEKLARLKRAAPGLAAEAQRTAAYGDRSDNAEYKLAKGALRRTNWQILEIEDQLKRVTLIDTGPNASGKVRIGSTVVLEVGDKNDAGTKKKKFQILGSDESDPSRGKISYKSPLGAALIGRAKGERITLKTENGIQAYRIVGMQ